MKFFTCILLFLVIVGTARSDCYGNATCTENEVCNECGSYCPTTCQSVCKKPQPCIKLCKQGCFCKPGFIPNEVSSKCIESSRCPRCECPPNEMWIKCNPNCELTCNSMAIPQNCSPPNPCLPGCICAIGLIRDPNTRMCVPFNKCSP